ncbi:MAG: type VI secretion system contractile sheath small subunit [Azoarcus sp.]|jgi:type VI secretion system protein ImpB|nr:type VI secretion system contractile sheath small subunit [Azoarcus sp.]
MATLKNTQHKLDRVRPPRVQITYDVEIGDAIETKELPFALGILGDYSGQPKNPLPKVADRKFVQVDRDNFNEVLKGMSPRLAMKVDNKLTDDDTRLSVELEFNRLEDFEPQHVVAQVAPLRKLFEARQKLSDLRNKMMGNDELENRLDAIVRDTEKLRQISNNQTTGKGE